ncbi:MAG: MFS transporter [Chloroflexota bacterium]|nr:MFS transporter [Chloroflexota bacterium]MDE2895803.1 MFS transporter [Chloroflexota bacterium]
MRRSIQGWRANTFLALEHPQFRILFAGTLFATLAYMMMFVAQSVVSYDLGGSNSAVGLVAMGTGISMLIGSPWGGVIADRVNRKHLIVWGQGSGAVMLALTGVLLLLDLVNLPLMFILTLILGATFVFMGPARNAFTADIVGPRLIGNAVALNQLAHSWGMPVAPMIAALLLESAAGGGGTYVVMGVLVSIGVLSMAVMPNKGKPQQSERRSPLSDLLDGVRYVTQRPQLRLMLLLFMATVVIGFMFRVLTPALLEQHLDRESTDMGLMMTVNGVASAVLAIGVAGLATSRWSWPLIFILMGVMGLGYLVMSQAQTYGVAVASMMLLGPGLQGPTLLLQAKIVMNTESNYLGRVTAFTMMSWGISSVSGGPAGVVADLLGEREILAGVALLTFVFVGLGILGWLAIRKHEATLPQIRLTPDTDIRGAQLAANGDAPAPAMPPPPMLRPVALMSGQKLRN